MAAITLFSASSASAEVRTETVRYTADGVTLQGYLAYDANRTGKLPGVLVVHEWWGLNDYARDRAKQLAELGYVAFACDMYGEGKATAHPEEAGKMAGEVRKNLTTWLGRATAGLKVLQDHPRVDASKLAAIGYCFGGSTAVQLALAGAPVQVVASFHGAPVPVSAEQAKKVQGTILICNGADDPFIPPAKLTAYVQALKENQVKVQLANYPGAVHSFTVPDADKVGNPAMKYNATADQESWALMRKAFDEAFR
jgi:dienelactone hydrolase